MVVLVMSRSDIVALQDALSRLACIFSCKSRCMLMSTSLPASTDISNNLNFFSITAHDVQPSREHTAAVQVVIVQSTAHGAPHLERRIEAFWRTWQQELEAMSDKEFAKQVPNSFLHVSKGVAQDLSRQA